MGKGERTRQMILERAADTFSTRGYFGSSMSDLLRETGLEKGGIYNHFASKEELALEAFDFSVDLVRRRFAEALDGREGALDRLLAIVAVFRSLTDAPILPGGCPVLNTAIEADDTSPILRDRARDAMTEWHRLIGGTVKRGVTSGELRPGTDPRAVATVVTATLEGAVMLSKLYHDPVYMERAAAHLTAHLHSLVQPGWPSPSSGQEHSGDSIIVEQSYRSGGGEHG